MGVVKSDSSNSSPCPFLPVPVLHRLVLRSFPPAISSVSISCSEGPESASEELREMCRSARDGRGGAGPASVGHAKPNFPEGGRSSTTES